MYGISFLHSATQVIEAVVNCINRSQEYLKYLIRKVQGHNRNLSRSPYFIWLGYKNTCFNFFGFLNIRMDSFISGAKEKEQLAIFLLCKEMQMASKGSTKETWK